MLPLFLPLDKGILLGNSSCAFVRKRRFLLWGEFALSIHSLDPIPSQDTLIGWFTSPPYNGGHESDDPGGSWRQKRPSNAQGTSDAFMALLSPPLFSPLLHLHAQKDRCIGAEVRKQRTLSYPQDTEAQYSAQLPSPDTKVWSI